MLTKTISLTDSELFVITDVLRGHVADLHFKKKSITDQAHINRITENQQIINEIISLLNKEGN